MTKRVSNSQESTEQSQPEPKRVCTKQRRAGREGASGQGAGKVSKAKISLDVQGSADFPEEHREVRKTHSCREGAKRGEGIVRRMLYIQDDVGQPGPH